MYRYAIPAFLLGCFAWAGDGPLLVVSAALVVALLFRPLRRFTLVAFVASPCVSPAFLGAGMALSGWWDGAAADWDRGNLHPFGHTSLDATGRYYPVAVGNDLVSLSDAVMNLGYDLGYNGTMYMWTRVAGPPTGAYRGEVPERAEVLASLARDSVRLSADAVDEGRLIVGGQDILFDAEAVRRDLRPVMYPLATVRSDWFALTDSDAGWPGMVVIARSTGAPILYFPLEDGETAELRRRWRALGER